MRWESTDPKYSVSVLVKPEALSVFRYGAFNPLRYRDPDGLDEDDFVNQAIQDRQWQANNVRQGMAEIKPVAEAALQAHPLGAATVLVTGERLTGGEASKTERAWAAVSVFGGVIAKGAKSGWAALKGALGFGEKALRGRLTTERRNADRKQFLDEVWKQADVQIDEDALKNLKVTPSGRT